MLVTLLVKFRNKDYKTTELGLLLQVLPVRIVTLVETLGSHLNNGQFTLSTRISVTDTYLPFTAVFRYTSSRRALSTQRVVNHTVIFLQV